MDNIDIAVRQIDQLFDIDFVDGDLKATDSFDTAINMTLYEERRADESEQPVNSLRRGWWGNELSDEDGFEIGSKLWQLYQARATENTNNRAVTTLQQAFAWFVEDGHATNIIVTSELKGNSIEPTVTILRSNNVVDSRSFKLWENTGAST